jgi:hypothetical protein
MKNELCESQELRDLLSARNKFAKFCSNLSEDRFWEAYLKPSRESKELLHIR